MGSGDETSLVQNDTHVMHMGIDPTLSLSMPPTTQLRLAPSNDHHLSSSNNLLKSSVSQNYVLLLADKLNIISHMTCIVSLLDSVASQ